MVCDNCGAVLSSEDPFCSKCGNKVQVSEVVSEIKEVSPFLRRANLFLEEKDWAKADDYCERVLDMEPENAQAYLIKLMIRAQVTKEEDLGGVKESFSEWNSYKNVYRYADEALKARLDGYLHNIEVALREAEEEKKRQEELRRQQEELWLQQKREEERAAQYRTACQYGRSQTSIRDTTKAVELFSKLGDYKDAAQQVQACKQRLEQLQKERKQQLLEQEQHREKERKTNKAIAMVFVLAGLIVLALIIYGVNTSHNERAERIAENLEGKSFSGSYSEYGNYTGNGSWGMYGKKTQYEYTYRFRSGGIAVINCTTRYAREPFIMQNGELQWDNTSYDTDTAYDVEVSISFFGATTVTIDGEIYDLNINSQDEPVSMTKDNVTYQ